MLFRSDYDKDGDLDLFVSGRVDPWNYPKPVSSFIYRNDSKNGHIKYTDVTATVAKDLEKIGLVCDALFTDFDNDGWPDLILAGEFMPISFLKNEKGVFKNITATSGIQSQRGLWNTITAGDFDNDGDIDYIVGNTGKNSFYRASEKYPISIYAKDFDKNGRIDPLLCSFVQGKNYLYPTRDEMIKQINSIRLRFPTYETYASATFEESFTKIGRAHV